MSLPAMNHPRRFLIVEYDTDQPNRWVPYPLSRTSLRRLFDGAGYSSMTFLGSRRSRYQRAEMYAALAGENDKIRSSNGEERGRESR